MFSDVQGMNLFASVWVTVEFLPRGNAYINEKWHLFQVLKVNNFTNRMREIGAIVFCMRSNPTEAHGAAPMMSCINPVPFVNSRVGIIV